MKNKTSVSGRSVSVTFLWLAAVFCVCLIISNIFVQRTWQVWGLPFQLTGAVLVFPVSYIINDCLTEVYGYRKARLVIWMGFALSAFVAIMSMLVCMLPDPMYPENLQAAENFNSMLGLVPRITIASLIAYFLGSTANAWVMSRMKVSSGGRRFGWRAILSSVVGEMADSLIFYPLVFWGIMPAKGIIGIMATQVVVKTLYEIAVLPVTAVFVKKLKEKEGLDTFDENISYNPFRPGDF